MRISLDTEYTERDIRNAKLLSVAIGLPDGSTRVYKPWELAEVKTLTDQAGVIYVQNGGVDWYMLNVNGLTLARTKFLDCMLMEHLIDENIPHNLNSMAKRYYNDAYKEVFWAKYDRFLDAIEEEADEYERKDAKYTFSLGEKFSAQLASQSQLVAHVHRLYWALFDTEISGLKVNSELMVQTKLDMQSQITDYLTKLRVEFNTEANIWELNEWAEEVEKRKSERGKLRVKRPQFSFSSDTQLRWLIYDMLKSPVLQKTKKGHPSTDYDNLKALAENNQRFELIAQYKEIKSIYSTFVEGLIDKVAGGRIYPSFHVNGTKNCGRISHSNPNMGNMPKEGVIRNFFIADSNHVIVGADYAQLEVVIEANLTNDKNLLSIILDGASKHDITAQGLGISRDQAKTLNFALQYGAGVHKVAQLLDLGHQDATDIFNKYWELYSGVKQLKDQVAKELKKCGKVTTRFGRIRHFPESNNAYERAKFERQAYNALIQGTGADCTNRATYLWAEWLKASGYGRLWFSVHDEIVGEVKAEHAEQAKAKLVDIMQATGDYIHLDYGLSAKSYGPFSYWQKT